MSMLHSDRVKQDLVEIRTSSFPPKTAPPTKGALLFVASRHTLHVR